MATVSQRPGWVYRNATIYQHCAVMGELTTAIRAYHIGELRAYAQYRTTVTVSFIRPRKRNASSYTIKADDIRYLTITADGSVLYDSRADIPCDMDKWAATNAKNQDNRPFTIIRRTRTEEELKAMEERARVRHTGG